MPIVVLPRPPAATELILPGTVLPPGYVPGSYLNMAVKLIDVLGSPTIFPALALKAPVDSPQSYYGILRQDLPVPIVVVGRGSVASPLLEFGVPLIPDKDVYLSAVVPGTVTQATPK
ncbi:MAG: hypothetical protein E4G90_10530 [Gemmatimonadales bacterium]|nr:MAG: hypothetical protein E4G90_10530 [Gemmatimonadales bacterium]